MRLRITSELDVARILRDRNLDDDEKARKYLAARVRSRCNPYVPKETGILRTIVIITGRKSSLVYIAPYAHYQYYGQVMAGRAPKHYTGAKISNHLGGPFWDKRMLADHGEDIEKDMAAFVSKNRSSL